VTISYIAGIALRNAEMVEAARHYGITVATCLPADPESKGGVVEASVRIAKADLSCLPRREPAPGGVRGSEQAQKEVERLTRRRMRLCPTCERRPPRFSPPPALRGGILPRH
jgi:transposase